MIDVVAIGELLIDFACVSTDEMGYPTMAAHPGGAPANYLAALSKYGCKTALIGKIGNDTFADLLIRTLDNAGIATDGVVIDSNVFTTLAFVTFDSKGERSFSFARKPGADTCLRFEEIDKALIDEAKVFHFGTLSLTNEPMRSATQNAIAYAKSTNKIISFDPNLRRPLWESETDARTAMLWGLQQADFVKISDEEIDFLWGCDEKTAANKLLNDFGVTVALITLGSKGAYITTKNANATVACPNVHPIDTTGAGDICGGAAMSRLLQYNIPWDELTKEQLLEIVQFATIAASLSTESYGGISSLPSVSQIQCLM